MSKRSVSYVKPAEPKFLAQLKAEIGFKEGPTVDTKRELKPEISDEEVPEKDEEQPVVVVLGPGDLTAEEAAQVISKEKSGFSTVDCEAPADGRILFRRPAKRAAPSKAEERMKEKRKKVKGVKNSSLLSFGGDDEVDNEDSWDQ